jgi:hypothetical protein
MVAVQNSQVLVHCICKKEKSLFFIDNFEQTFKNASKQVCPDPL